MIEYALILTKYYPNKRWSLNGDDYKDLIWIDETAKPSEEELSLKAEELKAEMEKVAYQEKRASEYPKIEELIIALWEKVMENRPEAAVELETLRLAVKDKYSKPEPVQATK